MRKGLSILEFSLYMIVIGIILTAAVNGGSFMQQSFDGMRERDRLLMIDKAIMSWAAAHANSYPDQLTQLQNDGYLPRSQVTQLDNLSYKKSGNTYTLTATIGTQSISSPYSGYVR